MPKKTVTLINYEGHQYHPEYGTVWSDTWAKFHLRRKKVSIGPTLVSMTDIARDREMFGSDPEFYGYEEPDLPEGDWKFHLLHDDEGTPTVLINAEWCTKANIEQAIGWYIRTKYGITSEFRFRWKNNRRRFFLHPW